jgi:hypothetical protein
MAEEVKATETTTATEQATETTETPKVKTEEEIRAELQKEYKRWQINELQMPLKSVIKSGLISRLRKK